MSDHAFLLGRYVNMQIVDVRNNPKGVVMVVRPVGYMSSRRILVEGITRVSEIPGSPRRLDDPQDWIQEQIDLGDEMYERQREEDPCGS